MNLPNDQEHKANMPMRCAAILAVKRLLDEKCKKIIALLKP